LPTKPGVYTFLDEENNVLYVGKAKDLKSRVSSYFQNKDILEEKTAALVSQIKRIKITIVESELESLLLEAHFIKKYKPRYNVRMTDNKSYPLIRITVRDEYPKVLFARKTDDQNSLYFGPYPSSSSVKTVLKALRRIFPFQSVRNHARHVCLYHHLGLCPCPPVYASDELKKEYGKNIKNIVRVLSGETKSIIREFEREREELSLNEKYEEAGVLQRKINALQYITQPIRQPFEYEINPNLRTDIRIREMDELKKVLNQEGYSLSTLTKIECYDISNTQGTHSTGSMVVFIDGEKESSLYRKFKIRKDGIPNDFAMHQEVMGRRLKHKEDWPFPDLFIVDGGKGQVSSVRKVFEEMGITRPIIGLAKREETIVTSDLKEISLPKHSPALHLIMRIRDEAHRFAITYHRKLRSKAALDALTG
jgi:excinuclease ABC subunit C